MLQGLLLLCGPLQTVANISPHLHAQLTQADSVKLANAEVVDVTAMQVQGAAVKARFDPAALDTMCPGLIADDAATWNDMGATRVLVQGLDAADLSAQGRLWRASSAGGHETTVAHKHRLPAQRHIFRFLQPGSFRFVLIKAKVANQGGGAITSWPR